MKKTIKCGLAVIVTVLMLMVDIVIILGAAGVGLFNRWVNFNWQLSAIKDYLRDRLWCYSELWDLATK